ncbi:hypothetical protein M378DRAFT_850172 [Amanita muscaria Koide BX008]|uniref:Uncharacterized protein n=1 Tax=Amanita muscaria (strain Koide BX008) TaxID=946122 RepID=A0A0C2WYV3_AMAMK|nr:hypothetical protein M378DRAFT_850172 [Amanita muscaria Koide BX008]
MTRQISLLPMSMAAADITSFSLSEKQHKKRQKIDKSLETMLEVLNSGTATRHPLVQSTFGSAARISQISQFEAIKTSSWNWQSSRVGSCIVFPSS